MGCRSDGVPTPCSIVSMELKAGAAVYAPWSTSRSVVDSDGNRQWQFFHAFADGYQGWLPAGATYEGNGNFRNPGRGDRSYGHLSQSPQNPNPNCIMNAVAGATGLSRPFGNVNPNTGS